MRFFANGPNIPNALLEERDNGNVVFFCGAGVSRPAGLPGFLELAQQVISELGTFEGAPSRLLLKQAQERSDFAPPLDQIFNLLQQDYGAAYIDNVVAQILRPRRNASIENHSVILRLSRNAANVPQVLTTNFDRLFERAQKSLRVHVPPALPDLASGQPLEGLVYLHGRVQPRSSNGITRQGFVISSSDFGRAYLSDGWATRFVRDLLRTYTIVLLGYSATDPPVRYLLEGLNARGVGYTKPVYAFDQGPDSEVQNRWRGRGVVAISYSRLDNDHSGLWDSLKSWASRSDDPDAWQRAVCKLASESRPTELSAVDRGQIVSLLNTVSGAKLFADANPPPAADWLCVLDRNVRYGPTTKSASGNVEFDPLQAYGLDDDPPRAPADAKQSADPRALDLISTIQSDVIDRDVRRLAGISGRWNQPLPPRLFHLARWIARVTNHPIAAWWAGGYASLHTIVLEQIEFRLDSSTEELAPLAKNIWLLLLEKFRHAPEDDYGAGWYGFLNVLKTEGWTKRSAALFARSTQPYLKSQRPWRTAEGLPREPWDKLKLRDLVDFKVDFQPRDASKISIPADRLPFAIRCLRQGLEAAVALLEELDIPYWRTGTFHSTGADERDRYRDQTDAFVLWLKILLDRASDECAAFVCNEVTQWPVNERFFFDKLRLYLWIKPALFSASDVADGLTNLTQETFWDSHHRRELLYTLKHRWAEFGAEARAAIEQKLLAGPSTFEGEEQSDYQRRKAIRSAELLGWLEQNNCSLSAETRSQLPQLRAADPRWTPQWDSSADESFEMRSGWVRTESDPSKIIDEPLSSLIEKARENTRRPFAEFTDYQPFQGVVKRRPFRALAALSRETRQGRYPASFWTMALNNWPDGTSDRLRWLFARRLARLPVEAFKELRYSAPDWLGKHLPDLAKLSLSDVLAVLDEVLEKYVVGGADFVASGIGDTFIAGERIERSRRTYDHAINSPIGRLTETIFKIIDNLKIGADGKIPDELKAQLDALLASSGEGRDHAIAETTIRIRWLSYIDPGWVNDRLVPMFALESDTAEPAWNGYLHDSQLVQPDLFAKLKSSFLGLFGVVSRWRWESSTVGRLNEMLVIACYWNQTGGKYVTYAEARAALQQAGDDGRSQALSMLVNVMRNEGAWTKFVKPFIRRAWPKEAKFQSPGLSHQFAFLAEEAGENFPDVVDTVLPFLAPAEHIDVLIYRMKKDVGQEGSEVATKYPDHLLALLDRLIAPDPMHTPYDLNTVLEMIADAAPRVRQDRRWRRLNGLVNRR